MNCPSRTDEPPEYDGKNQSPSALAADLTTRQDLNGIVNLRTKQDFGKEAEDARTERKVDGSVDSARFPNANDRVDQEDQEDHNTDGEPQTIGPSTPIQTPNNITRARSVYSYNSFPDSELNHTLAIAPSDDDSSSRRNGTFIRRIPKPVQSVGRVLHKFLKFIGPGFLVAVAYIDPGNYSTDVSAGVATNFKLLFIVLMSNLFAIILQSLAIRLGTVTGLNLAQHCRAHLPRWMNIVLYILGEGAIIATDIAEVRSMKPWLFHD